MEYTETITGREVDLAKMERTLNDELKRATLADIVKPARIKISSIDVENMQGGVSDWATDVDELDIYRQVEAYNGRVHWSTPKYAEGEKSGYDATFRRIVPEHSVLVNQSPLFFPNGYDRTEMLVRNQVIGPKDFKITNGLGSGHPSYLKVEGTNGINYLGGGNTLIEQQTNQECLAYWLFDVSTKKLMDSRSVFFDPEGLGNKYEFRKTFLVLGGIPFQAIDRARIVVEPIVKKTKPKTETDRLMDSVLASVIREFRANGKFN